MLCMIALLPMLPCVGGTNLQPTSIESTTRRTVQHARAFGERPDHSANGRRRSQITHAPIFAGPGGSSRHGPAVLPPVEQLAGDGGDRGADDHPIEDINPV